MFYVMLVIGIIFLGLGIKKMKRYEEPNKFKEELERQMDLSDYELLEKRIWDLEKNMYRDINTDLGSAESKREDTELTGLDKYMLILKYEKNGYSMEEICEELNINKGEVLLLRNIYKDYLK